MYSYVSCPLTRSQGCIGAIDGTMIDAVVPTEVREAYRNRHGKVAQNVLCVCDLDMKFTFLYTGWEGSSHDARVFIDALSQGRNAFPMPLDGKSVRQPQLFLSDYIGSLYLLFLKSSGFVAWGLIIS